MKCAIFTYGKFSSEYGGQCRLLSNGFKKKGINIVKLEGKKSSSLLKYFFYICGLRTGLMFTGFGYKSNIPKILTGMKGYLLILMYKNFYILVTNFFLFL